MVAKLADYEQSDLPAPTRAALRFADALWRDPRAVDASAVADLRAHFSDDQILDLGMTVAFFSGWQRFIEAFGIVPDRWADGSPPPFLRALAAGERGERARPPRSEP